MPEPIHESIKSTFRCTLQIGVFFETTPPPPDPSMVHPRLRSAGVVKSFYIYNEGTKLQREEAPGLDTGKVTVCDFGGPNLVFLPK